MRGEDEHEFNMTQTVLTDPVLTQKVLRLANSGMYSAFGQRVNTVSKAVLVLGTEAIGHLALGLKLIEELSKSAPDSDSRPRRDGKGRAGRDGGAAGGRQRCAARDAGRSGGLLDPAHAGPHDGHVLHAGTLGSSCRQRAGAGSEDAAAIEVLGLSLERVGRAAADHWGLPRNLVSGMRRIEPAARGDTFGHGDWLAARVDHVVALRRCAVGRRRRPAPRACGALAGEFSAMLGVAPERIVAAIEKAKAAAAADLSIAPLAKPAEKRARAAASTRMRAEGNRILVSGVSDMRDVAATASPGQMMSMALETVYQGLTFSRAVAFLRNRRDRKYTCQDGLRRRRPAR